YTLWLRDVGKNSRVPLAFVYGAKDAKGATIAQNLLKNIKTGATGKAPKGGKGGPLALTNEKKIAGTNLTGSALLTKALGTENWIVDSYLDAVMEARGEKERRTRSIEKWRYYYDFTPKLPLGATIAKREGE